MTKKRTAAPRYDLDRIVHSLISVGTLVAVVLLLRYLSDALIPFVIAMLLAYLLNPSVSFVERRIGNRPAAVLLTVFGGLIIIGIGVAVSIPLVAAQIDDFSGLIHELRGQSEQPVAATGDEADALTLSDRFDLLIESQTDERVRWVLSKVREMAASEDFDIGERLVALAKKVAPELWDVVTGAISFLLGLTGLIVVLLYVIFLLNDFSIVQKAWKDQLPPAYRAPLVQFLDEFALAMSRYFRGQFVVAAAVGLLCAIGFSVIGLRMGIVLGLFVGLLNMVPYLQMVALLPASVLAILTALERDTTIWVMLAMTAAVFAVVQVIQDAVLVPRIMGKATGLRPAIILLGVFVWGKVLGFLGVVLAIPLTCLGLAYYRRWVLKLKNVQVVAENT